MDEPSLASIEVFDVRGRNLRTLDRCWMAASAHPVSGDGTDDYGKQISSGAYIVRLLTPSGFETLLLTRMK